MDLCQSKLSYVPQKEIIYNKLLPYSEKLDLESESYIADIKFHLGHALTREEIHPEVIYWIDHLAKYVKLYGRKFSKEDHCHFIHLLFEILITPDLPFHCITHVATTLYTLLKKAELLSRNDLVLPWRPLYELYERIFFSSYEHYGLIFIPSNMENVMKLLVRFARTYFSVESTQEMLDQWKPLLCPYDTEMVKGISYFSLFFCTKLPPSQHDQGFKLWFHEFIGIWEQCQNSPAWENHLLWLFARLARDNIGYIDWEPYIPMVFNRLMKSFNLPSGPNKVIVQNSHTCDSYPVFVWIASMLGGGSSCLQYIKYLFKALESYYHPSNNGRWMVKLQRMLHRLPSSVIKRINKERYRAPTWETPIPDNMRLTDAEITEFVLTVKPVVLLAMFSKGGSVDSAVAFQNLATLRPELVIPPIIERLYSSLETLTEPHRLTAAMHCMVAVARSMVQKNSHFPEGPTHVIPLLMGALPGIDPNDIRKCLSTFHFISTVSTLIFFLDCSKGASEIPNLSEMQRELYLATVNFEDFVLLFMDRCFMLIENSCLNQPSRMDRNFERMNTEETFMEACLASTFSTLLTHCSPEIYEVALRKLFSFVSTRVFEVNVSGKNTANMCRSAVKVNSEIGMQLFMPHFTRLILTLTESEDIAEEERLDNELLFSLLVMSEIIRCDGVVLLNYMNDIVKILKRTLHLKCREGYKFSSAILRGVLKSFTQIHSLSYCSIPDFWTRCHSGNSHFLIDEWGKSSDLRNLNVQYHVPSDSELNASQQLLEMVLIPELQSLRAWTAGSSSLSREQLQCSLSIVGACLLGASTVLPMWPHQALHLNEGCVPIQLPSPEAGFNRVINTSDGKNFRLLIFETTELVLEHILETSEDDTKSLLSIINIYFHLVFHWGITKEDFETKWKGFHIVKKSLENRLHGNKQHIRALLIDRTCLQHDMHTLERNKYIFTETHAQVMRQLYKLSISHYFNVRMCAQNVLQKFLVSHAYAFKIILPEILKSLAKNPLQFHEEFKGCLYLIVGYKHDSLVSSKYWNLLRELWPALIAAQHSEKPSIIKLFDIAMLNINKHLSTLNLEFKISESCLRFVQNFCFRGNTSIVQTHQLTLPPPGKQTPNREIYLSLVNNLVNLIESGKLHWRMYHLGFKMLQMLIRQDIWLPSNAVNLFVSHLIYDTITIRKISISAVSAILRQHKRKPAITEFRPHCPEMQDIVQNRVNNTRLAEHVDVSQRPRNMWLQYNSSLELTDQKNWDSMIFVHKTHVGFHGEQDSFQVYSPAKDQPKLDRSRDELADEERAIYDLFCRDEFVEKLINYFSLEERKGHDKFDGKRLEMYKGLFQNYGDVFLPTFLVHLKRLTEDKQESFQRCAAEITAGLMRGSKHWDFEKMMNLKDEISPILLTVIKNITPETAADWSISMGTMSEDRDPNKYFWLFELLMQAPTHEHGSFLESSWLYLLLSVVTQQEWRVCELLHRILAYLMPKLNHSYQNVREKIGCMLSNVFLFDTPLYPDSSILAPRRIKFLETVLPKIAILESSSSTDDDNDDDDDDITDKQPSVINNHVLNDVMSAKKKDAINLFHTLSHWLKLSILRTHNVAPSEIFQILPTLCAMLNDTSDESLNKDLKVTYIIWSQALLLPESIDAAIASLKQIMAQGSWHAKAAAITFLQHMVFSNMFKIISNDSWLAEIEHLILHNLHDQRVEVREAAAEALSGMFHCEVLKVTDNLLSSFKQKCNKKLKRTRANENSEPGRLLEPEELIERHAGILGLCACINSFPYDVPEFMPDVLMLLADHLHDPMPIQGTIKKTLSNFRRTHYDSWRDHKLKFTDDQLTVITDLLVSPSYYA